MTHLEILKKAREILKSHIAVCPWQSNHICVAIRLASDNDYHYKADDLTKWIMEMLCGESSLKRWLFANGYPDCTIGQVNAHRVLWLDKLISEYEK